MFLFILLDLLQSAHNTVCLFMLYTAALFQPFLFFLIRETFEIHCQLELNIF